MSEKRQQFVLRDGTHARVEEDGVNRRYVKGDKIWLTRREFEALRSRVAYVVPPVDTLWDQEVPASDPVADKVASMNVVEVADHLKTLSQASLVEEVYEAERKGRQRKSVFDSCEQRLRQLADLAPVVT